MSFEEIKYRYSLDDPERDRADVNALMRPPGKQTCSPPPTRGRCHPQKGWRALSGDCGTSSSQYHCIQTQCSQAPPVSLLPPSDQSCPGGWVWSEETSHRPSSATDKLFDLEQVACASGTSVCSSVTWDMQLASEDGHEDWRRQ